MRPASHYRVAGQPVSPSGHEHGNNARVRGRNDRGKRLLGTIRPLGNLGELRRWSDLRTRLAAPPLYRLGASREACAQVCYRRRQSKVIGRRSNEPDQYDTGVHASGRDRLLSMVMRAAHAPPAHETLLSLRPPAISGSARRAARTNKTANVSLYLAVADRSCNAVGGGRWRD